MLKQTTGGWTKPEEGTCELCQQEGQIYRLGDSVESLCKGCILATTEDGDPDPVAEKPCPIFEDCETNKQTKKEK